MSAFSQTQALLDKLLPIPVNLPKIYLLGDTGAGKTTIIRQLLGTTKLRFPSVRQTRTTIAVTEYVISKEPMYRAAIVFKPMTEVARYVHEILEQAIIRGYRSFLARQLDANELEADLESSPDERFRLKFMLSEEQRARIASKLQEDIFPALQNWIDATFPDEEELDVVIDLALEDGLVSRVNEIENEILYGISSLAAQVCGLPVWPDREHFEIAERDLGSFVQKLKPILDAADGSISPIVERARVRGNISADWTPDDMEVVLIDGEGIGHDIKESGKENLSSRHIDYFYVSDAVMLVEDSERPFIGGGKSALISLALNGYLGKTVIGFSKLDKIEGDRREQVGEARRGLRNLLNALGDEQHISISEEKLDVRYFGEMNRDQPDRATQDEMINLLQSIKQNAAKGKPQFVQLEYDFELLAPFLDRATLEFREVWDRYLSQYGPERKPWQTVKAFNFRMAWGQDDYKDMKPVADLHSEIMAKLEGFIKSPTMWREEVTAALKQVSIDRFKQEFGKRLVDLIRELIIYHNQQQWASAADLRGPGSTRVRAGQIQQLLHTTVPSMTEEHAKQFKDAIKECFQIALKEIA